MKALLLSLIFSGVASANCDSTNALSGLGWDEATQSCVPELSTQSNHPSCLTSSDPDQDGWGWENGKSCRVVATCQTSNDPDGDGWGWENGESCRIARGTVLGDLLKQEWDCQKQFAMVPENESGNQGYFFYRPSELIFSTQSPTERRRITFTDFEVLIIDYQVVPYNVITQPARTVKWTMTGFELSVGDETYSALSFSGQRSVAFYLGESIRWQCSF